MRIDHIGIIVSSEETIEFYKSLGFSERSRIKRDYDTIVFIDGFETTLEMFIDPRHPKRLSAPEGMGLRHLALQVDDFAGFMANYPSAEVRTDWHGKRLAFIYDPDGQPIEIHE